ncbi:MAG TPA: PAS domain S-box protein [Thermoplasmata archaeon]|nr:PAS domain S-box protein [Thermoplasmata archaeon]
MTDEARYRTILEHISVGIAMVDERGVLRLANPAYLAVTGLGVEAVGRKVTVPGGRGKGGILEGFEHVLESGQPLRRREIPLQPETLSARRVLDVELRPILEPGGRVTEVLALVSDVTDRVTEEERARLFYEAFQQSTNAMEVTDPNGFLVDVNPAFEEIYGFDRDEVIGKRPNVVSSGKTSRAVYDEMWRALLDPSIGHWSGEVVNQSRDGREHPVLLAITAIRNPRGIVTHYVGVAVDLSERRAWEQQAVRSERLASLGQLAAGVAHELNTPLANIMLVAESVQRKSKETFVKDRMGTIVGQTELAARIVRGLLDFSRRHEPQVRELNLADVVRDAVSFIRGKQSEDVELSEEYARGPIPIRGDRDQLIQVFTNILNNGYEAMDGAGQLKVRVRAADGVARVVIQDTGPGIPPNVLPHIFEPFFTTKADRNGTGLGLAICHGIVQSHGGEIKIETEEGKGATFVIEFPLLQSTHTASTAAPD